MQLHSFNKESAMCGESSRVAFTLIEKLADETRENHIFLQKTTCSIDSTLDGFSSDLQCNLSGRGLRG